MVKVILKTNETENTQINGDNQWNQNWLFEKIHKIDKYLGKLLQFECKMSLTGSRVEQLTPSWWVCLGGGRAI